MANSSTSAVLRGAPESTGSGQQGFRWQGERKPVSCATDKLRVRFVCRVSRGVQGCERGQLPTSLERTRVKARLALACTFSLHDMLAQYNLLLAALCAPR